MTLMERRRGLMGQKTDNDIPIGVNLCNKDDPDYVSGKFINNATVGTPNYTFGTWRVYNTSEYLPYNSNYLFNASGDPNNSKILILDKNGIVIYFASNASSINGVNGQAFVKEKEASTGLHASAVRISTTERIIYMRIE